MRGFRAVADDSGVAGLVLVSVIAIIVFSALSVFLNKYIGDRTFERTKAANAGQSLATSALTTYFLNGTTYKMICPDTDYDGHANTPCDAAATTYKGVIPWLDIGLSKSDVVDGYGDYYTYLVSGTANGYDATSPKRGICDSITSDFNSSVEFTGTLNSSDMELLQTTETAGQGRPVPFVVISHGKNQLGAVKSSGVATSSASTTYEVANAGSAPTLVYSGPFNSGETDSTAYFDDQVYAPAQSTLEKLCTNLTPGGAANANIGDSFNNATATAANFPNIGTNGVNIVTSGNNKVAAFTNANSYLATSTTSTSIFDLDPEVRPLYIRATWTPNPTYVAATGSTHATKAGLSIATRATASDLGAGSDVFNAGTTNGITFRFYDATLAAGADNISGAGIANSISIVEYNGGSLTTIATSGATQFSLISNEAYTIEAFDDGTNVWMRVTQDTNTTNTVTIRGTSANDHTGNQQVLFINGAADAVPVSPTNYLDDVIVGVSMLGLDTNGTTAIAYSGAGTNGSSTGNISVEAWIYPRSLPTGSNISAIVSQWRTTSAATSSYRLYLDSSGLLNFQVSGTFSSAPNTETFGTGIAPDLNKWTHVAVTFDGSSAKSIRSYVNGTLARIARSTTDASTGVRAAAVEFSVGGEFDTGSAGSVVDGFNGVVSDVRVWTDVRSAAEVRTNYRRRLPAADLPADASALAGLAVNWRLDREDGGLTAQIALATPSTYGTNSANFSASGAQYSPTLSQYFRPFSRDFCPSGTIYSTYKCDFRPSAQTTASTSFSATIPSRLASVFAKVWGGGGGGYYHVQGMTTYMSAGGGGGFSEGRIQAIDGNTTSVAGQTLTFVVGGYGTGSVNVLQGGGGGGASGVRSATPMVIMSAGGGGGASVSSYDPSGASHACDLTLGNATTQCGLGGGGGGATATATAHAPDASTNCGGRGGNSASFTGDPDGLGGNAGCPDGGANPSGTIGGTGGGTATGGLSLIGAGGAGYDGPSGQRPGGGGGGGGASNAAASAGGGEAGGYDSGSNYTGYGGGGGAGFADTGVTSQNGALATAPAAGASTTDFYYSPSYLSTARQNPGRGGLGTGSTAVDGRTGAITILW